MRLQRLGQPDCVLKELVRRHRLHAVFSRESQGKDLLLRVDRLTPVWFSVLVANAAVFQPLGIHPAGVQRPKFRHGTTSTWADFGVAGTVVQVHPGHPIAEFLGRLPRVRLHMQQAVDRVARRLGLAAVGHSLKHMQRQAGYRIRYDPDARRVGRAGHGVVSGDADARRCAVARPAVAPLDATEVDHPKIGDAVFAHSVMMSHDWSGGVAVATAWMPRAITMATMPSMRSVDFALLSLQLPWWSVCKAQLAAIQLRTG